MKRVKFITSLNVKEVPYVGQEVHQYKRLEESGFHRIRDEEGCLALSPEDAQAETVIVPIHEIFHNKKAPTGVYIAYSEEVEELLGWPYRAIKYQAEIMAAIARERRETITAFKGMSLWSRLKFLFTGKFGGLE